MSDHGGKHWSELISSDVEGSKAFFAARAGRTYHGMRMGNGTYWVAMKGGVPVAGLEVRRDDRSGRHPAAMADPYRGQ